MKTFIAYRHTGVETSELERLLQPVKAAFEKKGVEAYCTFFEEDEFQDKSFGPADIMAHAFSVIEKSDFLFVIQASDGKSEGMLMEVGFCIARGIPVVVATKVGSGYTYLPDMARVQLKWSSVDELVQMIESTDFSKLT